MLFKLVHIEHKKTKKSFAFWLTIFGSMVIPAIVFLMMMVKPEYFTPPSGQSIWKKLLINNFSTASSFLFPMYVIYLIGLMGNIEYKSSNWKKLFVLPVRKELLISGKLLYLLLHIFVAILLFGINTIIFSGIAGLFHPEFNLFKFAPEMDLFFWLVYHFFLSVLGIIAIQFVLSVFFENILITLAIGLFLMVGSLIAAGSQWEYVDLIPYASPHYFGTHAGNISSALVKAEWINLIYFGVAFAVCLFFFKRKTVK